MADAFEAAWNVVKERQFQFGGVMEGRMGVPEEEPMVDTAVSVNETDHCCEKVRQEFKDFLMWASSKGDKNAETISWLVDRVSCEELYALIEGMAHEHPRAREFLQLWDKCSEENNLLEKGNDFFEDAWALSKKQPGIKQAWETLESGDSMPPLIPGLSGNKSKRHYQKFLTDAFGRTGSEELAEPNIGGGGGVFAIRPHVAYIGNDWNRFIPNLFRNVRDNPRALRWNPEEEYTYRVGDPRTFPGLTPDSPVIDLPPVSAQEVRDWHEITGGAGLDEDQMYSSNLRFYELRRRMNEIMSEGKWRTDPDKSAEMARLTAILLPQMIGGHFRIGDEAHHSLNIAPRGAGPEARDALMRKYPSAYRQAHKLLSQIKDEGEGMRGVGRWKRDNEGQIVNDELGLPIPTALGLNTTMPYIPQRVGKKGGEVDYDYEPWSREMRDKKYHFHEGDHIPFLEAVAPYLSPEYKSFLLSDPPYYGEPGEHKSIAGDTGEVGGFTHNLMSAIRPIVDRGVPTVAFNSARMPKHLWETGGLSDYQVLPRNQKGIQEKEGSQVMEVVGTANIPGMSQEMVNEMQTWPDSELPIRGFYRHNVFGR